MRSRLSENTSLPELAAGDEEHVWAHFHAVDAEVTKWRKDHPFAEVPVPGSTMWRDEIFSKAIGSAKGSSGKKYTALLNSPDGWRLLCLARHLSYYRGASKVYDIGYLVAQLGRFGSGTDNRVSKSGSVSS